MIIGETGRSTFEDIVAKSKIKYYGRLELMDKSRKCIN